MSSESRWWQRMLPDIRDALLLGGLAAIIYGAWSFQAMHPGLVAAGAIMTLVALKGGGRRPWAS